MFKYGTLKRLSDMLLQHVYFNLGIENNIFMSDYYATMADLLTLII